MEVTRLGPLPPGFSGARDALHRVAEHDIAPVRRAAVGRIDLRWHPGGFGTPPFDGGRVLRVEGTDLVEEADGAELWRRPLDVDAEGARWLCDWYGFAAGVLAETIALLPNEHTPSMPKLWPEHFDYAIEAGLVRANLGFSPGDGDHAEPYVYVGPWEAPVADEEMWNATGFTGAELSLAELLEASHQRLCALEFLIGRVEALHDA